MEEQNGSQSDGEGDDEKREELTENEKQIDRLKLEAEKVQAVLANMKQKTEVDEIKQEDMDCGTDETTAPDENSTAASAAATAGAGTTKNKNDSIKKEEKSDEESGETKTNNENEAGSGDGPTTETLVDVESDSLPVSNNNNNNNNNNYQWKNDKDSAQPSPVSSAPPTSKDSSSTIPTIKVDPSPNEENAGIGDESNDHPKGTSRTIIHEDHMNSLNELFAPTQTFHQYSPTLTSLNPQKINESLTDALSKHPPVSSMNTITASQSKTENSLSSEPIKETLAAKPSVEISRSETSLPVATSLETRLPLDILKGSDFMRAPLDYVACSDDERSISPENALTGCHKTYPQEERDPKTTKPNLQNYNITGYINPLIQNMLEQSILGQQPHALTPRTFEKSLLYKELGNKVSNAALTMNTFQNKVPSSLPNMPNKMALQDLPLSSSIDSKSHPSGLMAPPTSDSKMILPFEAGPREFPKQSLLEQRLLAHTQPTKSTESPASTTIGNNVYLPHNSFNQGGPQGLRDHPLKQPSLLEQRLLADTVKSADPLATANLSSNNKMFLPPGSSGGEGLIPRPGSKPGDELSNKSNDGGSDKPPSSSPFTTNRGDPNEKNKIQATSLRINPPTTSLEERVQIGTHTWFPEVVNDTNSSLPTSDYYNNSSVSSNFRIPVSKTYTSYSNLQSLNSSCISDPKNPKNLGKRALQPVPIAPAPNPLMPPSRGELPLDYVSPNGGKCLTFDN